MKEKFTAQFSDNSFNPLFKEDKTTKAGIKETVNVEIQGDHSKLENLDYDDSGHTGFESIESAEEKYNKINNDITSIKSEITGVTVAVNNKNSSRIFNTLEDLDNFIRDFSSLLKAGDILLTIPDSLSNYWWSGTEKIELEKNTFITHTRETLPNVGKPKILYILTEEGSSYVWDEKEYHYVIAGSDYSKIQAISGGNAYAVTES